MFLLCSHLPESLIPGTQADAITLFSSFPSRMAAPFRTISWFMKCFMSITTYYDFDPT